MVILQNIMKRIFSGDSRTVKARKNILCSIGIKVVDSLVYLLLVPVTLHYLNPYEYGIWLTLNSILMWINSFDIGLGNGLRNKLAIAMAKGDCSLGRIYVSTAFFMLICIMGLLLLFGSIAFPFIDWYDVLNTTSSDVSHLGEIVYVSFAIFCMNFIFKIIGNVYLALQYPAVNNFLVASGHLLSLIIIYVFSLVTTGNLFIVAFCYSASPLVIYILAYPVTFRKIFPALSPSYKYVKLKYINGLFGIGAQFFLLQISGLILFAMSNLIISHLWDPGYVTPYNIAYRYFSIILILMNIILSPMWSATTEAYEKGDIAWIRISMRRIRRILLLACIVLIVMTLFSKWAYGIWVGDSVEIPYLLSALTAIYIFILLWSLSYSHFLNGLGKLRLQCINTLVAAILFIPIGVFLGSRYGINGIVLTMCLMNLSGAILNRMQFYRVISGKARGIWDK
jgi:putative LPS biosynthesis related polysaccharide transporter/flippase